MHTPLRYLMCSVHGLHVFSAELRIPTILVNEQTCGPCGMVSSMEYVNRVLWVEVVVVDVHIRNM